MDNTVDMTLNNCTFKTEAESGDKCAVEIHSERGYNGVVKINKCTVDGTAWNSVNGGLWREVDNTVGENGEARTNFTVIVDGKTVQESTWRK